MNFDAVRRFCLGLPGATERVQWEDDLLLCVGGKMFAVLMLEPGAYCLSFKCEPEEFAGLVERQGVAPAPYLARNHWVALERFDALPAAELEGLLRRSYELVVARLPRKAQAALAAPRPRRGARRAARPRRSSRRGKETA